jgi:hypothetical protein
VVGSSLVKNAFVEARQSYDGCSLGLKRNNIRVWWQRKGDMSWGELVPRITLLLQYEPPKILVIHCGGNSIGIMPLFHLRRQMKEAILKAYPSGEHEFTSGVCCVCVYQSLVFCVVLNRSL